MKDNINIMIVGVGGQGSLLASKLLGKIFLENDYDKERIKLWQDEIDFE